MSAVAEIPVAQPPAVAGAPAAAVPWQQRLQGMDRNQRLKWGGLAALVAVGVVAAAFFASSAPEYRVLFSNLGDKDAGAIVAQLSQMNVPYRYTEGGGAILVPADKVHDARLKLATQGLPKGSIAGFEVMDNSKFGITQFQERVNYQRALEGELTRSIQGLSAVQDARVHLALPNQNGFFREQQKPSASVIVDLHPGRMLDRAQIAGIVHLVASSVPELTPESVSVLDDSGKLLSQSPDGSNSPVDLQQLMYQQQLEKQYVQRILDILEPVVGKGNVKAQVTADLDFSQTESTSELHAPNQGQQASSAVRSQQLLESTGAPKDLPPTGVPGATTNQPPQAAAAPINGQAQPLRTAEEQQRALLQIPGSKREVVTNYEVDKTVRVTRNSTGNIRRMTAAVVVNYLPGQPAEPGGAVTPQPMTEQQQAQMLALVRETIGFSAERGDSVNLMNTPFQQELRLASDLPVWQQPETIALVKTIGWPVGFVLGALILMFGVVRPLMKSRRKKEMQQQLDLLEAEELERPALPQKPGELPAEQLRLEQARALAKQNPIAVANIVKTWVNGSDA
ncbi:MAG: flagellar basal-body MS-ring/collar protein FliF [Comamonas sp.]|jgi:flagellar M-ring protein FliF|nr:flagellar basal-body MS-ring/collar protein FliF [Comamonas sp.]